MWREWLFLFGERRRKGQVYSFYMVRRPPLLGERRERAILRKGDFGGAEDETFGSLCLNKKEDQLSMNAYVGGGQWDHSPSSVVCSENLQSPSENCNFVGWPSTAGGQQDAAAENVGRRKRRRSKCCKNKEEVENQRMTHIAVERNRRKQMNEYLAVLRSLMPPSYVQRGDQASIVGGAINFVKELEQLLQSLEAHRRIKQHVGSTHCGASSPFGDLFTFPQYNSTLPTSSRCSAGSEVCSVRENSSSRPGVADVEVTLVESHANLKVLSRRRPRQLLKLVAGFQSLQLTILHLNVTTIEDMVLYSISAKVEEDCQVASVDEIATAVRQIMGRIHAESGLP
ncbi:transcription factor bHLH94-like isoform X2 [Nymphaea colorata]|uniref:transcription factor bHLH94-like isoform X2 n=1 Tax=Nymphaea colorata TaxID=210225 RepID=UPI00129DB450|nr:transcription factor bHLH94-like isoform X2 [Nymphaea colorata]